MVPLVTDSPLFMGLLIALIGVAFWIGGLLVLNRVIEQYSKNPPTKKD